MKTEMIAVTVLPASHTAEAGRPKHKGRAKRSYDATKRRVVNAPLRPYDGCA